MSLQPGSPRSIDLTSALARPGTVLLDTAREDAENGRTLLFTDPLRELVAHTPEEVPPLLDALDAVEAEGCYAAGYLSYESGYVFEKALPVPVFEPPLAWFGVYDRPIRLKSGMTFTEAQGDVSAFAVSNVELAIDRAAFAEKIDAVKASIREGDVYQINFTDRVVFDVSGSPLALFEALRRRQHVSYGAYLHTPTAHILCLSPELFFQREGMRIWTRPMKGTVRRGRTAEEDDVLRRWLAADAKSRAENLMIVDLLRNDLSRCCVPGSVWVRDLFTTEVYETLIQMTSTVEGELRDGIGYADLFRALFPCGSVTGAPKIRAMQRIRGLEVAPRGVYCGAIGYVAPEQRATFNVAIRTVVLRQGKGVMGTGSGIVWDSDAGAEYEECLLKAAFLMQAAEAEEEGFELIETMKAEGGVIPLLDLHARRMRASAKYFGFSFDAHAFSAHVDAAVAPLHGKLGKIRVTLDQRGRFAAAATPLEALCTGYRRVLIADPVIDAGDVFFYHKTTRRRFYEDQYRRARAAGYDEVLFLNQRGEVTEGSRTNVFIREDETLYTPPVASGLLAGVYRRHVFDAEPGVVERVLYPEDLFRADAVLLSNAVHGLVPVEEIVSRIISNA